MKINCRIIEGFHTTIWRDSVEVDTTKYKCFEGKTKEECEDILEVCDTETYPELQDLWEELECSDPVREKYTGEEMNVVIDRD